MISLVVEHQSSQGEGPVTQSQCLVVFFFLLLNLSSSISLQIPIQINK